MEDSSKKETLKKERADNTAIPKLYDPRKRDRLKLVKFFLLLTMILLILLRFVLGISWVNGVSMSPTMHDGEMVLYSRLTSSYEAGDVVSIQMPSGDYYIKRIVALEGDQVELIGGFLYVNGVREEAAYVHGKTNPQESDITYPIVLSAGQVFVLGDNREGSVDSRTYGPMSLSQIRGKVLLHAG